MAVRLGHWAADFDCGRHGAEVGEVRLAGSIAGRVDLPIETCRLKPNPRAVGDRRSAQRAGPPQVKSSSGGSGDLALPIEGMRVILIAGGRAGHVDLPIETSQVNPEAVGDCQRAPRAGPPWDESSQDAAGQVAPPAENLRAVLLARAALPDGHKKLERAAGKRRELLCSHLTLSSASASAWVSASCSRPANVDARSSEKFCSRDARSSEKVCMPWSLRSDKQSGTPVRARSSIMARED
eukprot:CAMPEP_0168485576 /NCGR_PEP_ID=MMETSP0228-20121227/66680_1 /TAXON_ID=133427 /ORGANISM="Protoceratium reticulatum, Strain CCCM 535 (=CCMP 1889)" /LENGTH=238 /DNA_ID=CAMNT_0008502143 /DNA_START=60 /DNA_END=773 /DNA_ORIENTATION=-